MLLSVRSQPNLQQSPSNLAAGRRLAAERQHGTSQMAIAIQAADQLPASMRDHFVYMEDTHRWAQ